MSKVKSLIICATPLQVMIAERIVALHPEEEFHLVIYSPGEMSAKYKMYSDRIKAICSSTSYITRNVFSKPIGKSPVRFLTQLSYLIYYRFSFKKYRRIQTVYVSSYDSPPIRSLMSVLSPDVQISSFDDGLINLLPKSYNLSKSDHGFPRLFTLFGLPRISEVYSRIKDHYTIYDAPNAAHPSPIKIDLFTLSSEALLGSSPPEIVSVFLGQPISEFVSNGETKDKRDTERIISELGCSLYLPHPRESYRVDGVEYIETPLIAEDYLLQELEKHPNRCYMVYSYFSTTLMNLKDHPRVKMVSCRPASVPERWHESYELLERMGIEIREFPNI